MNFRSIKIMEHVIKDLDKKIARKKEEILALTAQITAAEAYINGIEDSLRSMRPGPVRQSGDLRPESDLASVREILKIAGKPLHIDHILEKLNKPLGNDQEEAMSNYKKLKLSLSGSLNRYANQGKIFKSLGRNTFTLIEKDETKSIT